MWGSSMSLAALPTVRPGYSRHPIRRRDQRLTRLIGVRTWGLLAAAIASEVAATLALRASQEHAGWLVVVVLGYVGAFVFLTLVLRAGLPVGVAYGIWGACGTAATALVAAALFGEALTWPLAGGIALIIAGVLLVEFGSHDGAAPS